MAKKQKTLDKRMSEGVKDTCLLGTLAPLILQVELCEAIEARLRVLSPENVVYNNPIYSKESAIKVLNNFLTSIK